MGSRVLLSAILCLAAHTFGNTLTVTNNNDTGAGSLRQAIFDAQHGDAINFAITGMIVLTNGELLITNNLSIVGSGATNLAISGNHSSRILEIASNTIVSISGLTLRDGQAGNGTNSLPPSGPGGLGANGGGILNAGTMVLSACTVAGNSAGNGGSGFPSAPGGGGGGVCNNGTLTLNNCTLSGNSAGAGGGGISAGGFGGSTSDGAPGGYGGGIYNAGMLSVSACTFNGNAAGTGGVGGGRLSYFSSAGGQNGGPGGSGGGIYSSNIFSLTNCTFNANIAGNGGNGGYGSGDCSGCSGFGGTGGEGGAGGAILSAGALNLVACTLSGNTTGSGGAGGDAFYGSYAYGGNGGNSGSGGAISASWGTLRNALVALNAVGAGGAGGGARTGGGTDSNGHSGSSGCCPDLTGSLTDQGHNWIGANPKLGPLTNNGGDTFTMALLPGSPAIDAGDDALVAAPFNIATDQRGLPRLAGFHVDIGAYEATPMPPTITALSPSQTVVAGTNLVLSVAATGTWPLSYQWYHDQTILPSATSTSLVFNSVRTNDAGTYNVVVSNYLQSVTSAPVVLTVIVVPHQIDSLSPSQTVAAGTNLLLSVSASSLLPLRYQWRKDGADLLPATNSTLPLNHVQPNDAGTYAVVVSHYLQSVTSAPVVINVSLPPFITLQPQNQFVSPNGTATFLVAALGLDPLFYQWQFNGTNRDGATSTSLIIPHVQASALGNYTVIVTNSSGSVTSSMATLAFWPILIVSNTNDSGPGSLRQALLDANAGGPADHRDILLTNLSGTITLSSTLPTVAVNTTITGPGANLLTLSGGGLAYNFGTTNTLSSLAVANGSGILNAGNLNVMSCALMNNSKTQFGGGLHNSGNLTVFNSTIATNTAYGQAAGACNCQTPCQDGGPGAGGGLYSASGTVNLVNCTFSANLAVGGAGSSCNFCYCPPNNFPPAPGQQGFAYGGGIYVSGGIVSLLNCTISGNNVSSYNFNYPSSAFGGGLYNNGGTVLLKNTLVAGNLRSPFASCGNLWGIFASQEFNLLGESSGSTGWLTNDLVGTCGAPLDPKLGPLTNNGGPTLTLALLPGSPALDSGDDTVVLGASNLTNDQRGFSRKSGPHVDIGAYELEELVISGLARSGNDIVVRFLTEPGGSYRLESAVTLTSGVWITIADNIAGTGGIVQVTHPNGATRLQRFYRLRQLQ